VLLATALILAQAGSARAASATEQARQHYANGTKQYDMGHWDEAIAEFEKAYDLRPDPSFLFNLAQAHRRKGDLKRALDLYKNYAIKLPRGPQREEVEEKIAALQKQIEEPAAKPAAPFGAQDTVTAPTCGGEKLTAGSFCNSLTWTSKDALCISGSIPALPVSPTTADYNDNWGISLGINATEATGGTLGQSYSSIAFTLTGAPLAGLRAQLHKKGESDAVSYCAALTPGTPLPLTSFSTNCFNDSSSGTAIKATDVPNIDKLNVQVYSSTSPIAISNLCLTGITLIK
jgi:Tetratricopeptide repeat